MSEAAWDAQVAEWTAKQFPETIIHGPKRSERTVSFYEVKQWVNNRKGFSFTDRVCADIAIRLNGLRWPNDPPSTALPPCDETCSADEWWDIQGAASAAKSLSGALPLMLRFWEGQRWSSKTRGGYDAIKALSESLAAARQYIEFPFGEYEPIKQRPGEPKNWHMLSIAVAGIFTNAAIQIGGKEPKIHPNSALVSVVYDALNRMRCPPTKDALSKHLSRWIEKGGALRG